MALRYIDFDSNAEIEPNGSLRVLSGVEALENSIRLWVASFRGEVIRKPERGGYIVQWLMKPMNEETRRRIKEAIQDGLFEDFQPKIQITRLDVIPNYELGYWQIELQGYSPALKEAFSLSEKLRRLST